MKIKLLFTFLCVTTSLCLDEYSTSYCITDSDYGFTISDNVKGKDIDKHSISQYLENVTSVDINITNLITTEWKNFSSISNESTQHTFHKPVLDERWEGFSMDEEQYVQNLWENPQAHPLFFSVRVFNNTSNLSEHFSGFQWYHLKLQNGVPYICNSTVDCDDKLDIKNLTIKDFYLNVTISRSMWKLHKYQYIYTETRNSTSYIYNGTSTDCYDVQHGWIKLHVAMCSDCKVFFKLQSNNDTNKNETFTINGTGQWKAITQPFKNFTSCFNLSVTTFDNTSESEPFWAIGDKLYFSTNHTCNNITRYISFINSSTSNFTCENSNNTQYNITSHLPEAQCVNKTHQSIKKIDEQLELSSFNFLYLLIIIPIVLVVVGIALYWCKRKNKIKRKSQPTSEEKMEMLHNQPGTLKPSEINWIPIKISEFHEYIRDVFDADKKYQQLQQQFSDLPSGYLKPAHEGKKEENSEKNRFNKIYPYDENRVKLEKSLGVNNNTSDYINASYVHGFNSSKEYILTQNPLKNTVQDFFRMIWQEQVEYIVMISTNTESYYRYLPDLKKTEMHYDIEVFVDEVKTYEFYDYRSLIIRRYGQNREMKHLHFHSWSPQMLSSHVFLEFVNHLLKIPHENAPIVFHCLAGVGRSATIVLCDIGLRSAAIAGSINFYDITKKLRECRADVVPNLSQYQLAHLIVFESLHYKDTSNEINSDFSATFSRFFEGNSIKKTWSTFLENTDWLYEAINPYVLCTEYPLRNRYVDVNLLPALHSRVVLQYKHPDYIHAMFVSAYNQQKNFIVAQQPVRSTISDFWIMILQNHVTTIFNLNEPDVTLRGSVQFIPTSENEIIKIQGNITIQFSAQEEHLNYEKLSLAIYSSGKYERHVTVLNVKNWPKIKSIPESTDVMISIWEVTREQKTQNFPILVCCDDGISSSSLVVCFFYLADKMLQQSKCDVVGAVKAVRRSHTKFINFEQFVFLHHCALAFYNNCYKLHAESR